MITTLIIINLYFIKKKSVSNKKAALPSRLSANELLQILSSSVNETAIAVYSTEDIILEFANDEMMRIWGKNHNVTGKPMEEELTGLKAPSFLSVLKSVWATGENLKNRDTPYMLEINGEQQTGYFDVEYRTIKDQTGKTLYLIHTVTNVTQNYLKHEALKQNVDTLKADLIALKQELMYTGEELELSYVNTDRSNNMLLEALDCFSTKIELASTGYWSVNLQTQEFSLSENGKVIYGVPKGAKLTLADGLRMIDKENQSEVIDAIEETIKNGTRYVKNYKINPLDGSEPKWVKSSGKAHYNEEGIALALSGSFLLTQS
ncbi:PAS domain-containing protein [Mucilaginibacter sp. OK268]|uniref:PAS domain-containing protein n=1 Tax=Mucilaginibacter sp. OK268 TaxID=1881048 RepID=UPI00115F8014|nr:PAS domain-containing protein [Mucilaginibacter sp. OK268]